VDIDHVIPESLAERPNDLQKILAGYELPADFDLRSLKNLLPVHRRCNLKKRASVLEKGRVLFFLHLAEDASERALKLIASSSLIRERDDAKAKLAAAIESGMLTPSDVLQSHALGRLTLTRKLVFADGTEPSVTEEQVESFLDRPVLIGGNPEFYADFGDASGKRMTVRTCREYRAALTAGFYALSTYDIKSEAFLKSINSVLEVFEAARVPRLSFIDRPFRGVADIGLLPISLLPTLSPDGSDLIFATGDLSLGDVLQQGDLKVLHVSSHEISIEWRYMGLMLRELLRADLDNDGIEDILCECYQWATEGTFGFGWVSKLSRTAADQKFTHS
jgi:hypothetical protein